MKYSGLKTTTLEQILEHYKKNQPYISYFRLLILNPPEILALEKAIKESKVINELTLAQLMQLINDAKLFKKEIVSQNGALQTAIFKMQLAISGLLYPTYPDRWLNNLRELKTSHALTERTFKALLKVNCGKYSDANFGIEHLAHHGKLTEENAYHVITADSASFYMSLCLILLEENNLKTVENIDQLKQNLAYLHNIEAIMKSMVRFDLLTQENLALVFQLKPKDNAVLFTTCLSYLNDHGILTPANREKLMRCLPYLFALKRDEDLITEFEYRFSKNETDKAQALFDRHFLGARNIIAMTFLKGTRDENSSLHHFFGNHNNQPNQPNRADGNTHILENVLRYI